MINTFCPRCNNPLTFEDAHAGMQGQCDKCNSLLTVPHPAPNTATQQYYAPPPYASSGVNGLGIAGFVISLVSILPLWILPLILAPLSIILSAVALRHPKKGFAIAGVVIGSVALLFYIIVIIVVVAMFSSIGRRFP